MTMTTPTTALINMDWNKHRSLNGFIIYYNFLLVVLLQSLTQQTVVVVEAFVVSPPAVLRPPTSSSGGADRITYHPKQQQSHRIQHQRIQRHCRHWWCSSTTSGSGTDSIDVVTDSTTSRRTDTDDSTVVEDTSSISTSTTAMQFIRGIRDIIDQYDVFLLDMWGVLHDGSKPYDGVLDAIQNIVAYNTVGNVDEKNAASNNNKSNSKKKQLIILSNSSKRRDNSIRMLTKLGFDVSNFDSIITSGEVAYQLLLKQLEQSSDVLVVDTAMSVIPTTTSTSSWWESVVVPRMKRQQDDTGDVSKSIYVLGSGDDDIEYCTSCGWTVTGHVEEATLIVARGTFTIWDHCDAETDADDDDTKLRVINKNTSSAEKNEYDQILEQRLTTAAQHRIPMLVTNPDKIRPDSDRSPMPGTIGDLYEQILAQQQQSSGVTTDPLVHRIGKPFDLVYALAMNHSNNNNNNDIANNNDDRSTSSTAPRVCMIGDALETDITGGMLNNIDTVWVIKDGIHGVECCPPNDDSEDVVMSHATTILHKFNSDTTATYAAGQTLSPTYVLPHFRW